MSHKRVLHGFECLVSLPRQLFLALLVLVLPIPAFAKMYEEPKSFSLKDASQEKVELKVLPKIDPERLLAEDKERGKNARRPEPLRFAVPAEVSFTLDNSGTWQDLPDGRVWRLRIQSPGAKSLNLGITRFDVTEGVKLWIYDPGHKHVEGPYTSKNRSHAGSLWTPIIEGEELIVEVFVPTGAAKPGIVITKANRGYRGFKAGVLGSSEGACEIDVICPEGDPWRDQIRAVNVYTINGNSACTGTLMNNTFVPRRNLVLSANHCGVNSVSDATVVVFWNFDSPTCGTHNPGPLTDTQTGATLRANNATGDFVLFELDVAPDPGFNVFHAGWDANGAPPLGVECIHHPAADVKAISPSHNAPFPTASGGSVPDPNGTHWRVEWDGPAVTEPGSSGSCIFALDTKRCIGTLTGGPSACGVGPASLHDFYGRLDLNWTGGGTAATRLSGWLDGGSTGVMALDGDPHITTLDGAHYDFQGAGEYVSLRDPGDLEVQTRQAAIATTFNPGPDAHDGLATCVSLNTAVAARVGKHRVTYQPNLSGVPDPSGLQLRVDGALTTLGPAGLSLAGGGRLSKTTAAGGLQVDFPDRSVLVVTPGWWTSQSKWYLNVDVVRSPSVGGASAGEPGVGGIAGAIVPGSWLPALPDGSSMGPMPGSLHQRYVDLYQKFGEAWRVTEKTSLFDYAPGTSTDTFTMKSWPLENPPCVIPQTEPVRPATQLVAERACRRVTAKNAHQNCVFDVRVTGNTGFARTYEVSQRIRGGLTTTRVSDAKDPTKPEEPAVFVAIVTRNLRVAPRRGGAAPAGAVQFMLDGEKAGDPVRLVKGQARWKTARLKAGEHKVSAQYTPAAGTAFQPSGSAIEPHTVKGTD